MIVVHVKAQEALCRRVSFVITARLLMGPGEGGNLASCSCQCQQSEHHSFGGKDFPALKTVSRLCYHRRLQR